jgi:quinol-cytochrome oxidoreductase complex cytochrome b subunit
LGDSSNLVFVDFLSTPFAIMPEWYFVSIFAILRSFYLKLAGILLICILLLFFLY